MAERKMTPKGFLHKTNTKAANSAGAFLAQYRDYLVTGELAPIASPIIAKLDKGELLPTPALKAIAHAVMAHIIAVDTHATEEKLEADGQTGTQKPWLTTVYEGSGAIATKLNTDGEEEDLVKGFDHASDADRWADRRLFEGASDWYAVVESTVLGSVISRIERNDAIARILKKPKGPAIHQTGKSTKTLGFGVKAKQTRSSFSRG